MSLAELRKVIEDIKSKRKGLFDQMQNIASATKGSNARSLTGDEQTKLNALMADFETYNRDIEIKETEYNSMKQWEDVEALMRGTPANTGAETRGKGEARNFSPEEFLAHQRSIIGSFCRRDYKNAIRLSNEVRTGPSTPMLTTTLDAGGALQIPLALYNQIVEKKRIQTFWDKLCNVITMPVAKSLGVPSIADDMADGEWTKENIDVGTTRDVLERKELQPYMLSKIVEISENLLAPDMTGFDVEGFVADRADYKFNLTIERAMFNGTGVNQLLGLNTLTSRNATVCDGTSHAFTYANAVSALTSLRAPYRNQASTAFMVGTYLFRQMLGCVDANDKPLWQPSLIVGVPDKFMGKSVYESEVLPATDPGDATTAIGYFGDFSYYWIPQVNVIRLKVLDQPRANAHIVQYRFDRMLGGQPIYDEAFTRFVRGS